jgi:hypothetical protein
MLQGNCETEKRLVWNLENRESNHILKISPFDEDDKMKFAVGNRGSSTINYQVY